MRVLDEAARPVLGFQEQRGSLERRWGRSRVGYIVVSQTSMEPVKHAFRLLHVPF